MHDVHSLLMAARSAEPEAVMKMLSPEVVQLHLLQKQKENHYG